MLYFKNVQSPNDVIISHQVNITTRGKFEILKEPEAKRPTLKNNNNNNNKELSTSNRWHSLTQFEAKNPEVVEDFDNSHANITHTITS